MRSDPPLPFSQDLITQLLVKNPQKRLGAQRGAEEIKAHPFFKGINWALLRQEKPPFVPKRQQKGATASGDGGSAPAPVST